MRPAQVLAREMNTFSSDIAIWHGGKKINAKSMLELMAACLHRGAHITLVCEGSDEQAALEAARRLHTSNFGAP